MSRLALTLGALAVLQLVAGTANADFRGDLGRRLNIADPQYLILNLPPRPACLPGTVYTSDLRTILRPMTLTSKGYERGPEFSFTTSIEVDGKAEANVSGVVLPFALAAEEAGSFSASLTITKAHVLEIAGPGIRSVIKNLPRSMRASTPAPAMVQRAYEGVFTLKLAAKSEASGSLVKDLYKRAISAGAKAKMEANGIVVFASSEPLIFAFEVARITDFAQLTKAARDLEDGEGTIASRPGSDAPKDVIMGADVPSQAPSVTMGSTGATATVGSTEIREHAAGGRVGSATGYVRVPASEFESVNPTPYFVVR